jgi:translation initiation factor IF-2
MKQGAMHKINDAIDADTAELIVAEFGHKPKRVSESDVEEGFIGAKDVVEHLEPRAPVVTIMGHVDHGKTSLLDAIRQANVAAGEAGGITQHIGAYQVTAPDGGKITFIDTPGHEAFTAMRARGAKVTDIVVLVVAADDGVMPQTIEAINHAKAAQVPMIVAINKIDKPGSDPTRVATELLQHEVVVESMSGETQDIPVSALKRTNLDKLLEGIALQAEILELKANPDRSAEGFVIEAKLERGRGPVGTLLVQRGTLRVGDIVVAGSSWGRVRALLDDKGKAVVSAGPSVPVEVLGFDSAPEAGDQFAVVESEARAREITDYRVRKRREALGSAGTSRTLEQMMQQLKEAGKREFPLVVKGDVQGSVEAIMGALGKLGNEEVMARIVHSGVGQITESDVALAAASKAIIIGFNVRANLQAKQSADSQGIEIRYYSIIYDLVDQVKAAMSGLLAPTRKEVFLGYATIKQVFNVSKVGKVAGCQVTEGKVERGAKVRLLRDKTVIHEGSLAILKRFKDDVREVPAGQECGMSFANYQDIREGDEIECFQVEVIARTL